MNQPDNNEYENWTAFESVPEGGISLLFYKVKKFFQNMRPITAPPLAPEGYEDDWEELNEEEGSETVVIWHEDEE